MRAGRSLEHLPANCFPLTLCSAEGPSAPMCPGPEGHLHREARVPPTQGVFPTPHRPPPLLASHFQSMMVSREQLTWTQVHGLWQVGVGSDPGLGEDVAGQAIRIFCLLWWEGGVGRGSRAACVEGPPALGRHVGDPSTLPRLLEHEGRSPSKALGAERHSWGLGRARWQAAVQTGLWGRQCPDPQ